MRCSFCPAVKNELAECTKAGGAFKAECNELEHPVAWGCSTDSNYCCCGLKDGKILKHRLVHVIHSRVVMSIHVTVISVLYFFLFPHGTGKKPPVDE